MKIIELDGKKHKMYKPDEVAAILGYHPRTIRRFIQSKIIKAVDSNKHGVQPVWWIPEEEIKRIKKTMVITSKKAKSKV